MIDKVIAPVFSTEEEEVVVWRRRGPFHFKGVFARLQSCWPQTRQQQNGAKGSSGSAIVHKQTNLKIRSARPDKKDSDNPTITSSFHDPPSDAIKAKAESRPPLLLPPRAPSAAAPDPEIALLIKASPGLVSRSESQQSHHRRKQGSFSFSESSLHQIATGRLAKATTPVSPLSELSSIPPPVHEIVLSSDATDIFETGSIGSYSEDEEEDIEEGRHCETNDEKEDSGYCKLPNAAQRAVTCSSRSSPTTVVTTKVGHEVLPGFMKVECRKNLQTVETEEISQWMLDWVMAGIKPPVAKARQFSLDPARHDDTSWYFPTFSRPEAALQDAVHLEGWASVSFGEEDEEDGLYWYVQVTRDQAMHLSQCSVDTRQTVQLLQLLAVKPVSDFVGSCLVLQCCNLKKDIVVVKILPVQLSRAQVSEQSSETPPKPAIILQHQDHSQHGSEKDDDYLERYAPAEQNDAVLHWRFCLDVILSPRKACGRGAGATVGRLRNLSFSAYK
jgi:hypothetical protein